MTKEQWDKIAAEIAPHLEAIRQVAEDNGIDLLNMNTWNRVRVSASYISPDDRKMYCVDIKDGIYKSECEFETIGKHEIKKALTPAS